MFIEKALWFKCYPRPISTFAWQLSCTQYEWKNQKGDNSQFLIIIFMVVKNFSAICVFWITVWRTNKEQSDFFGTKSYLKGLTLTSKTASGYFGQSVWNWIKGNVPRFEKSALTLAIKASCKLPAGASNIPQVTGGKRGQSLPAEIFACLCR